jgi:hypothetical protein
MDENHFVMKKIQTILDELVLHVHTTTYYRSSLERTQGLAKEFNSKRETDFRPLYLIFRNRPFTVRKNRRLLNNSRPDDRRMTMTIICNERLRK